MTLLWRWPVLAALALLLVVGSLPALAHEGHVHKVMGTVVAAQPAQVLVKGTDGKTLALVVDAATRVVRGTAVIKVGDLRVGERVVASYMPMKGAAGAEMLMAKEIKAAASATPSTH